MNNDILKHHGVRGMKWGIRNVRDRIGTGFRNIGRRYRKMRTGFRKRLQEYRAKQDIIRKERHEQLVNKIMGVGSKRLTENDRHKLYNKHLSRLTDSDIKRINDRRHLENEYDIKRRIYKDNNPSSAKQIMNNRFVKKILDTTSDQVGGKIGGAISKKVLNKLRIDKDRINTGGNNKSGVDINNVLNKTKDIFDKTVNNYKETQSKRASNDANKLIPHNPPKLLENKLVYRLENRSKAPISPKPKPPTLLLTDKLMRDRKKKYSSSTLRLTNKH